LGRHGAQTPCDLTDDAIRHIEDALGHPVRVVYVVYVHI